MKVDLIACTPDFLKVIWCAARTCYSWLTPQELWESSPPREEMLRVARRVIGSGHLSVVEHCTMTFAVSGISRACLAQYTRHRIGVSFSVQSQRHVDAAMTGFAHVAPPSVAENPEALAVLEEHLARSAEAYRRLVDLGVKREDARFVLPQAAAVNLVTTLNLRSLMYVYGERVAKPGAQWEIREMVARFAGLVVAREPWLSEYFPEARPA
ncbi:MAG: FAD-dependent thymidylate synthase [Moorellales bacterium]